MDVCPGGRPKGIGRMGMSDSSLGAVTVDGGPGSDTVIVNDGGAGSDAYTLTATALTRAGFGGLTYADIETLTLLAETGDNAIHVQSLAGGMTYNLFADAGDDTVTLSTGDLAAVSGCTLNLNA